ncbi:MAG: aminomethyl-transferring glycine dehydrogenase [Pseudomonadota bacterium]
MTNKNLLELKALEMNDDFTHRHIGPNEQSISSMLSTMGSQSLAEFTSKIVPQSIRSQQPLTVGEPLTEKQALEQLSEMAAQNKVAKSYIGMGYYNTITPPVILRNVLENPGWYTAYTPYQPEIAQGRLEALINFQQLTLELTGLDLASASLLDEATAAAEAMALAKRASKNKKAMTFFIDETVFPQTIDVVRTRAEAMGLNVQVGPAAQYVEHDCFGLLLQYPGKNGDVFDLSAIITQAKNDKLVVACAADIYSLVILQSPATMGADIVFGSAQRFGVPMGFGGPHAAYFATHDQYKRLLPGRVIGVSKDTRDNVALRMAMQTREQHIRREKATSNICTAQVLLANIAAFYAVYHGPERLKAIAERIHRLTSILALGLQNHEFSLVNDTWFDTITVDVSTKANGILERANDAGVNLRIDTTGHLGVSCDETTQVEDILELLTIFTGKPASEFDLQQLDNHCLDTPILDENLRRKGDFLTHFVFNRYHSETDMLRYLKRLENRDLSLTHSMIPLGSCTMKLNATAEMIPVTWPEFGNMHPFAPAEQTQGYAAMLKDLGEKLLNITGFEAISLQPNSGAQGEFAGLLTIKKYLESKGESHRNICLIPSSAHGTNPASAQMASMQVVVVKCDKEGNVDRDDLQQKVEQYSDRLAALMITYPSTHGVYEEGIEEICALIHAHGGQVYMDGANMNAQVGVTSPGLIGADVSHLNLHKTFCIPHGGGGPGMGPIGVKAHLAPHLPGHIFAGKEAVDIQGAVSAAPFGSASILPISWAYVTMMGSTGLEKATQVALLSANYLAQKLAPHYSILYTGRDGLVAHECIIDLRPIKATTDITEVDIAKRLMDFGFHAPTMSFPVPGTFMIEPTESESQQELERFVEAMIAIREEIRQIENTQMRAEDSPLRHAPHTLADMADENWQRPYSKTQAAFPLSGLQRNKFWPSVNRIDDVYGDRNFICSCPPMETYE